MKKYYAIISIVVAMLLCLTAISFAEKGYEKFFGDNATKVPAGWSNGKKTGWDGQKLPPGLYKKFILSEPPVETPPEDVAPPEGTESHVEAPPADVTPPVEAPPNVQPPEGTEPLIIRVPQPPPQGRGRGSPIAIILPKLQVPEDNYWPTEPPVEAPPTAEPPEGTAPPVEEPPTVQPPEDNEELPQPSFSPIQSQMINKAKADLAQRLGVDVGSITLLNIEGVNWGDTSLGLPQPGMGYAQVITPGFKITLLAGNNQYVYHTDENNRALLATNS